MVDPLSIIERCLAGELTDAEHAELADWLSSSEDHRRLFLSQVDFYRTVASQLISEQRELAQTEDSDATTRALAELARLHDEGLNQPISLEAHRRHQHEHDVAHRRVQRKARLILAGSFAAVIALAGVVGVLLSVLSQPVQQAQLPVEEPVEPEPLLMVGTLTDERDAVWQAQSGVQLPHIGDALYEGTTLELVEGFAEITTRQGAVAILEAPATIELIGKDNALRLMAGKLVGICETPSSKGFAVHTALMDVTDLGTRFGVWVDDTGQCVTHVFEGSVQVSAGEQNSKTMEPRILLTDQSLAVDPDGVARDVLAGVRERFDDTLSLKGLAGLDGAVRWSNRAYGVTEFDRWPRQDQAILFQSDAGVLKQDVPALFSEAGRYESGFEQTASSGTIPRGTRVCVYTLLLNPASRGNAKAVFAGSVRFEGEVLGVITNLPTENRLRQALGHAGLEPDPRDGNGVSWLEDRALNRGQADRIELQDERKTFSFEWLAVNKADLVRIVVREPN